MKRIAVIGVGIGLSLLTLLLVHSGIEDVGAAVIGAGWATLVVVLVRAVAVAGAGIAWRLLLPARDRVSNAVAILIRFVREAVNQLLPVGQVGGDVVGVRLTTFWRVDGAVAGAVTIADVAIQAATQFVFAVVGLAIVFLLKGDSDLVRYAAGGLAIGALAIAVFFVAQAGIGSRLISSLLRRLAGGREWAGTGMVEAVWRRLAAIYADHRLIARVSVIHLVIWFVGAVEVYVALHAMGYPVTVAEAIVIESLGQAVRGAAFAIPGGLGVQEGGYIALAGLFGVPPGPALALSLLKRVADLALGLPFLAAWQVMEGRRLLKREPAGPMPETSR